MKTVILKKAYRPQSIRTNLVITIPMFIRESLGIQKEDELDFILYSDKTVEIKKK